MESYLSILAYSVSHPAWGEWIEIAKKSDGFNPHMSLTPHGVSGLKSYRKFLDRIRHSLTPHGVSGLKFPPRPFPTGACCVSPRMG